MKGDDALALAIGMILATISLGIVCIAGGGVVLMLFWNCAMPDLFGLPEATYRNAVGLVGLAVGARAVLGTSVSLKKER